MARLKLLGGATTEGEAGVLVGAVARRHPLALLAVLASSKPSTVSRGKLAGLLWPETPEEKARRRLNACLHRVRSQLGEASVLSLGDDLQLNEDVLSCDVRDFERALKDDHERSVELYGGPFLDGFRLGGSAGFEHWVDGQRARLRRGYRSALEALAEEAERRGQQDVAARWWRERLHDDPYDSRVTARLMEALAGAGNRAAALRVARVHGQLLQGEFGAAPPPEFHELAQRLSAAPEKESAGSAGDASPPESPASPADGEAADRSAGGPETAETAPSSVLRVLRARRTVLAAAATILFGAAAAVAWHFAGGAADPPDPPLVERSVAVLPLDNTSPSGEHAFFADAMTEEITSALTEVPELLVTSRSSASRFNASGMRVADFARTLGVSHVIEGSVQRVGDRVRIAVQLIDARTDRHVWSQTYERTLTSLFDVQAEVAGQVANRLAASFSERERARIRAGATDDPVAYDLYLRASGDGELSIEERVDLLRRALDSDPTFWPGWERLGFVYLAREQRGQGRRWADSSRAAFRRAIAHADSSVVPRLEAYEAMIFGGDADAAIARLREAAEARPSDLSVIGALGHLNRIRGRLPEAARWRRHAALLDPLEASRWQALFPPYWWAGLYEPAERALRRAVELDPQRSSPWLQFMWHWKIQGRTEDALAAVDSAEARGRRHARLDRGFVHWWAGEVEEAAAIFSTFSPDSLSTIRNDLPIPMAHALSSAGDSARAAEIAERYRAILEAQAVEDFDPEWRVFPRIQLAAFEGDVTRAVALFRTYVERGGRDYNWFLQSPLFHDLREEPDFWRELEDLTRLVGEMRRQMQRDLRRGRGPLDSSW